MKKKAIITTITIVLSAFLFILWNQKPCLYIFMWSGYIKPELISKFEEKFHCRVYADSFDSNESMYAKLKFGGDGYDIVLPSSYYLQLLADQKLIQPINPKDIPNSAFVDTALLTKIHAPQSPYGIPFLMSFSGIAYRSDRVHEKVTSWNIFSNKKYKGRMTILNDIRESVGSALLTKGFSANTTNIQELQAAKNVLLNWKKNIAKFESEQHKNGLAGGEFLIVQGYASDCFQILKEHPEVRFSYPKEGSLVTIDYFSISSGSKQKQLAYDFINFLLMPENIANNMMYTGGRAPHTEAKNFLPKEMRTHPLFYPEENSDTKLECLQPIKEGQGMYSAIWSQVRSDEAK